mmetsp:Transcript_12795/g.43323  ORF Transcript_12795/g.43323 Transcript_12795/m.43323 type:complete len:468 (+) Transcript_12795:22-1425(+)
MAAAAERLSLDMSRVRMEGSPIVLRSSVDRDLEGGAELLESPRAVNEEALRTPREALDRGKRLFALPPEEHNHRPIAMAWNSKALLATFGSAGQLRIWDTAGTRVAAVPVPGKAKGVSVVWLDWDSSGEELVLCVPGSGLWIWTEADGIEALLSAGASAEVSFAQFSRTQAGVLGLGTTKGDIFLYARGRTKGLEKQDGGRHSAVPIPGIRTADDQIVCGDWLRNGSLALASGCRLKVSEPITARRPVWKTFSKFRVHKMQSKIPAHKLVSQGPYSASPTIVKVSNTEPPFIAMNLGDKVMTVMDHAGLYREEGFFVPPYQGSIVYFDWLPGHILVIGLSNGYIIVVNVPLLLVSRESKAAPQAAADRAPTRNKQNAMVTTRIFDSYMSDLKVSPEGRLCVLGDSSVKALSISVDKRTQHTEVRIDVEFRLPFKADVGTFVRNMAWGPDGIIAVTSNVGHVFTFIAE